MRAPLHLALLVSAVSVFSCGSATTSTTDAGSTALVVDGPTAGTLVASPVGTTDGDLVQGVLGPDGGTLTSDDGRAWLKVPPGALGGSTTLTLQRVTSTAPGAIGPAVRLTKPDGVTFAAPVTISFALLPSEVSGVELASLGAGFQNANGLWEKQPATWDAARRTVSVSTNHFSDWSALAGRQIRPGAASVQTKQTLQLQVEWCEEMTADQRPTCKPGGSEPCLVAQCRRTSLSSSVFGNWAVNGVAGGSSQTGTLAGSGSSAVFTAPAMVPSPAQVSVSVRVDPGLGGSASTLNSNITITDKAEYQGEVYFFGLQGGTYAGDGKLVFREFENLPDVSRYAVVSGTFYVSAKYPDCDPVEFVEIPAAVGPNEGQLVVWKTASNLTHFWNAGSTVLEVPMQCGKPRMTLMVPISVSLHVTTRPYTDVKDLFGKQRGLPLGGGVAWFFNRVE